MSMPKFVTKKKVTVTCNTPFRIGQIPYSGVCRNLTLSIEDISKCLENKARVVEILSNGKEVALNFANYDTYNGPSDVDENSVVLKEKPADPEIEQKNQDGETIKVLNKQENKEEKEIRISTTVEPKEEVTIVENTKLSTNIKEEIKGDTSAEVKAEVSNAADTKIEVENDKHNNTNSSNNNQQNQKKNKFK